MKRMKTVDLVTVALMAAILCILAPISIPLSFSPIPLTLGMFAVYMAGILLGREKGTLCVLIYLLLGAVGLPVFSGYSGGFQKIIGPTGGYLWGYLFLAWLTGLFVELFEKSVKMTMLGAVIGAVTGTAVCYAFGTLCMGLQLSMTPMQALWAGVIPFVPLDLVKLALAVVVCCPIRHLLLSQGLIEKKIRG